MEYFALGVTVALWLIYLSVLFWWRFKNGMSNNWSKPLIILGVLLMLGTGTAYATGQYAAFQNLQNSSSNSAYKTAAKDTANRNAKLAQDSADVAKKKADSWSRWDKTWTGTKASVVSLFNGKSQNETYKEMKSATQTKRKNKANKAQKAADKAKTTANNVGSNKSSNASFDAANNSLSQMNEVSREERASIEREGSIPGVGTNKSKNGSTNNGSTDGGTTNNGSTNSNNSSNSSTNSANDANSPQNSIDGTRREADPYKRNGVTRESAVSPDERKSNNAADRANRGSQRTFTGGRREPSTVAAPATVDAVGGVSGNSAPGAALEGRATDVRPFIILDTDRGALEFAGSVNDQIAKKFAGKQGADDKNQTLDGWVFLDFDPATRKFSVDKERFMDKSYNVRKEILEIALKTSTVGIGERDRARIISFLNNLDVSVSTVLQAVNKDTRADVAWALRVLDFMQKPFNRFLGVFLILIAISSGLQVAIDAFCMMTPPVMAYTMKKYGNKKPFYMSPEAFYAYKDSISQDKFKSYFWSYIFKSIPKMLLLGICMAYILAGNVVYFAMLFADWFSI